MKSKDLLEQLSAIADNEERNWLITQSLLDTLPQDLTSLVWAASIPHWFNTQILTALRPELADKVELLYYQLQSLPFVEPYAQRGHNIHELTRQLMLRKLWNERPQEYVLLSKRVSDYLSSQKQDSEIAIEYFYNLLVVDSQKANRLLLKHTVRQDSSLYRDYSLDAYKKMILEHVNAGRQVEKLSQLGKKG